MSTNNSATATLSTQPRSLADFQTAPFDQTDICESTFTSPEDKELKKGICHGLSVLWIKRFCDLPSETGEQRIAFLEQNIRKAAKMQNYYHQAKGAAFSPAYKKKTDLTTEQLKSLEEVKGLEARRVTSATTTIQPELNKQRRRIEDIEEKYSLFSPDRKGKFLAAKAQKYAEDQAVLRDAELQKKELMNQVDAERETVGASELNWALGMFKMIANQDSRKFTLANESSAAVVNGMHTAVGDGPLLTSLQHGSMQDCTNKNHAWSAYLDKSGFRVFDPIKGEFFADSQSGGALLDALKASYDSTGQTLFTIKATRVAKL